MTSVSTATVETLTAEVRVLMVGSRQITLSVAKQLDYAPVHLVDVFGRVNLGQKDRYGEPQITIIGRRKSTGVLVLSVARSAVDLACALCGCTTGPGAEVLDRHRLADHSEIVDAHSAARRAPLIVLAGLK